MEDFLEVEDHLGLEDCLEGHLEERDNPIQASLLAKNHRSSWEIVPKLRNSSPNGTYLSALTLTMWPCRTLINDAYYFSLISKAHMSMSGSNLNTTGSLMRLLPMESPSPMSGCGQLWNMLSAEISQILWSKNVLRQL